MTESARKQAGRPNSLMVPERQGVRPEIQALRAAAVMMVVIYHLWPATLPGGYAGVDVFFVISGFLITSHLLREVARTGRVSLPQFWARRARRLLPASLLVIVVTAIATWALVPVTFWQDWFRQMAAAVLYVLNWQLAGDSIDYLAAENDPSPVQHYWSLSVEEQFYILWPILIVLGIWLARKRLDRVATLGGLLAVVTVVSFGASVYLTMTNPAQAYFVTTTRAWEFGLGGLLSFAAVRPPARFRAVIGWLGIAGVLVTAFMFTATTPFPGYTALLPTVSTAAVIWAGVTSERWSLAQVARFRPVQYTGDISYSLYLWHWPLIVIVPYALGRALSFPDLCVLLLISYVLAALTKRFVEEPGRTMRFFTQRRARFTLIATAAAMAVALVVPAGGFLAARAEKAAGTEAVERILEQSPACLGAAAMVDEGCDLDEFGSTLYPNLAALKIDNGIAYDCYNDHPEGGQIETCTYGSDRADATRVAVTGDSHGAMLDAGLVSIAKERNWTIDSYVSRGCTWASPEFGPEPECAPYRIALQNALEAGDYDTIVTTARRQVDISQHEEDELAAARAKAWSPLLDEGVEVVAVIDNPLVPEDMTDCVINHPNEAAAGTACVIPEDQGFADIDTDTAAAVIEPRVDLVDVSDLYCVDGGCPMVIGNTIVYRDRHHLSCTYITTAAPYIADRVEEATAR